MESKQIIRIVLLLLLGLIAGKTPVVWANDLIPVAVIGVDPGRTWFYDGEDVVFDSDDSYVPNGQGYIIYSKWYINGVYRKGGYYRTDMNICFRLNGSANNGCYELGAGQTTVQVTLEVTNSNQYGTHQTTLTYTVQEHKGRKYFVKDHLGNVRATVNRDGNVLGYDDYYPFGLAMPGHSNNTANPDDSYKFTGHERDDEGFAAGKGIDYMNARTYDPLTGMFMQIDPMAYKYPGWSPYNYTMDNPVLMIDPDGEDPCIKTKNGCKTWKPVAQVYNKARQNEKVLRPAANFLENKTFGFLAPVGKLINHILTPTAPLLDISGRKVDKSGIPETIHEGKQGKHIVGHNNFIENKSELTVDAQELLDDFHSGNVVDANNIRDDNTQARVEFNKVIGIYVNPDTKERSETTIGKVVGSKTGTHIIPMRPKIKNEEI